MKRPDWDSYFLNITAVIATRSTCPKRSVGCVLTRENRIIGTGYNGASSGLKHCTEVGCEEVNGHCGRALHAEQNALLHAVTDTGGAVCYLTAQPCSVCARLLIAAGIIRVVYRDNTLPYRDEQARKLFAEAGVDVEAIA